jgi:pimeloyl-ACP methyl ester carboxylesterase
MITTDAPRESVRLVLLPGLDGTEILFGPLCAALPSWLRMQIVTFPERGPNGYDDLLPLVTAAVDDGSPCLLFAWSFSGPLALRAAHASPQQVRGIVLASSFVRSPMPWLTAARWAIRGPTVALLRTLRRLPVWCLRSRQEPLRVAKAKLWQRVPAATLASRGRAIGAVDARADLRETTAPILYVRASSDRIVTAACAAEVQRARPDLRLVEVPGRHFAIFTHPEPVARAVAAFAAECASVVGQEKPGHGRG